MIACCKLLNHGVCRYLSPPTLDFGELRLRPIEHDLAAAEINCACIAVNLDPFAFLDCGLDKTRTVDRYIDTELRTAHHARLVELTSNQRGMCGATAASRYYSR